MYARDSYLLADAPILLAYIQSITCMTGDMFSQLKGSSDTFLSALPMVPSIVSILIIVNMLWL